MPVPMGRPVIRVTSVGSTMDLLASLADRGAPTGTVVLAGHQSAGRGRSGRSWRAEPGDSILMSFLHYTARSQAALGVLAPVLGLAVAVTLDEWLPGRAEVKWPNDVLVEGRKIAGVLTTSRAMPGGQMTRIVAGIGLNVRSRAASLPEAATSLSIERGEPVPADEVLAHLLSNLATFLERFELGEDAALVEAVSVRMAWRGQPVQVEDVGRVTAGVLDGIDSSGALRLVDRRGGPVRIVVGDLTRGPRPIGGPDAGNDR